MAEPTQAYSEIRERIRRLKAQKGITAPTAPVVPEAPSYWDLERWKQNIGKVTRGVTGTVGDILPFPVPTSPEETPFDAYVGWQPALEMSRASSQAREADPDIGFWPAVGAGAGAALVAHPIMPAFEAVDEISAPVRGAATAPPIPGLMEQGVRKRYDIHRSRGVDHVSALAAAYEQARDAGEISNWKAIPLEFVTDPLELLPGGAFAGVAKAVARGAARTGTRAAARPLSQVIEEAATSRPGDRLGWQTEMDLRQGQIGLEDAPITDQFGRAFPDSPEVRRRMGEGGPWSGKTRPAGYSSISLTDEPIGMSAAELAARQAAEEPPVKSLTELLEGSPTDEALGIRPPVEPQELLLRSQDDIVDRLVEKLIRYNETDPPLPAWNRWRVEAMRGIARELNITPAEVDEFVKTYGRSPQWIGRQAEMPMVGEGVQALMPGLVEGIGPVSRQVGFRKQVGDALRKFAGGDKVEGAKELFGVTRRMLGVGAEGGSAERAAKRTQVSRGSPQPAAVDEAVGDRTFGTALAEQTGRLDDRGKWLGIGVEEGLAPVGRQVGFREQVGGAVGKFAGGGKIEGTKELFGITRRMPGVVDELIQAFSGGRPTFENAYVGLEGSAQQQSSITKVMDYVNQADRIPKKELEEAIHKELAKRTAIHRSYLERYEEAGMPVLGRWNKAERAYKGDMPSDSIDVRKLRDGVLTDTDIDSLYQTIDSAYKKNYLQDYEASNAMKALGQLLETGRIPSRHEVAYLELVFGSGFAESLMGKRGGVLAAGMTPMELIFDILNAPRANVSSVDMSALLRQGGMLATSEMQLAVEAAELAMRALGPGGENILPRLEIAMRQAENGKTWQKYVVTGKLFMHRSGVAGRVLGAREEAFLSSLAGRFLPWVRASERSYGTFLNKLRWDVMDRMIKDMETARGSVLDPSNKVDRKILENLASYINSMSGRGRLPWKLPFSPGKVGPGGEAIQGGLAVAFSQITNAAIFSPRLFTSRLLAPYDAVKIFGSPENFWKALMQGDEAAAKHMGVMRRHVARQMAVWFGTGSTIMTLAHLSGAEVEMDWRSSDFGKFKIGNTRYDVWSGYTQIARLLGQLATGEKKSASTGEFTPTGKMEALVRFTRSKFSPGAGLGMEYVTGEGFLGEDRNIIDDIKTWPMRTVEGVPVFDEESFWTKTMGPLFLRDLSDAVEAELEPLIPGQPRTAGQDQPSLFDTIGKVAVGTLSAVPGWFGEGLVTYVTTDEIAMEMTKDRKGGPVPYTKLKDYEKAKVREIKKQREEERGVSRTQGYAYDMEQSRQEQFSKYQELADALNTGEMTPKDAREAYDAISDKHRIERATYYKSLGASDEEEATRAELKRRTMTPAQKYIQDYYDEVDRAREASPGDHLIGSEYGEVLNNWEIKMQALIEEGDTELLKPKSEQDPNIIAASGAARAAMLTLRMNAHPVEIPEDLLRHLDVFTQTRYRLSRKLRREHEEGKESVPGSGQLPEFYE